MYYKIRYATEHDAQKAIKRLAKKTQIAKEKEEKIFQMIQEQAFRQKKNRRSWKKFYYRHYNWHLKKQYKEEYIKIMLKIWRGEKLDAIYYAD